MLIRRLKIRVRRQWRRIVYQGDSVDRIARGVSAGCFAAAFPLPGLQIPLSLFFAYLVRGNRVVAIIPQFLANPATFVPLAYLQYSLGAWLWPSRAATASVALGELGRAIEGWSLSHPLASSGELFAALSHLGLRALGPLLIGILISGACAALAAYPLTFFGLRWLRERRAWLQRRSPQRPPPALTVVSEPMEPQAIIDRYASGKPGFFRARTARLLVDGAQAYPEMLEAIRAAAASVDLETYILVADRTGERFAAALREASGRGVRVRLLYDAVGSLGLPERYVAGLRAAGVEVAVYHPLRVDRPLWAINRRDHRKILVVDGRLAFTGGLNISDANSAVSEGGGGWRDTHLRLEDAQAAAELGALFEESWHSARTPAPPALPEAAFPSGLGPKGAGAPPVDPGVWPEPVQELAIQILGNQLFRKRWRIRHAYLQAIRAARRYILIENAYFIPDRKIRKALYRAVRRGVQVTVVVARENDVEIAALASRALYGELLRSGVRLYEWSAGMMHAKTAVIDDAWAVVGSYNLDHRSLLHNLEAVVLIADQRLARQLRDLNLRDLAQSQELLLERHEARPWTGMILEAFAYSMRYWL